MFNSIKIIRWRQPCHSSGANLLGLSNVRYCSYLTPSRKSTAPSIAHQWYIYLVNSCIVLIDGNIFICSLKDTKDKQQTSIISEWKWFLVKERRGASDKWAQKIMTDYIILYNKSDICSSRNESKFSVVQETSSDTGTLLHHGSQC